MIDRHQKFRNMKRTINLNGILVRCCSLLNVLSWMLGSGGKITGTVDCNVSALKKQLVPPTLNAFASVLMPSPTVGRFECRQCGNMAVMYCLCKI